MGPPRYRYGTAEKESQIGLSTGLAWTESGGDILSVEVALMQGKGRLILTGQLGDVMKESAQAGLSYIRSRREYLSIEADAHEKIDIHLHVPEEQYPRMVHRRGLPLQPLWPRLLPTDRFTTMWP